MKRFQSPSGLLLAGLVLLIALQGCEKEKLTAVSSGLLSGAAVTAPGSAMVSTYAGCTQGYLDGQATKAMFNQISQLVKGPDGILYVADYNVIRKITNDGVVSTLAGCYTSTSSRDGQGQNAYFTHITGLTLTPDNRLFAIDREADPFSTSNLQSKLRKITLDGNVYTLTLSQTGNEFTFNEGTLDAGPDNSLYLLVNRSGVWRIYGQAIAENIEYRIQTMSGNFTLQYKSIAVGRDSAVYLMTTGNEIYKKTFKDIIKNYPAGGLSLSKTVPRRVTANTVKSDTTSIYRDALAIAADGTVYFTDGLVIRVLQTDGSVSLLAGSTAGYVDGPAAQAKFENILSLELADNDTVLYVADNFRIRKITLN
ncbi:hypothetical protein [Mucilaginibacter aquariorum]|uniref:Uncharacterized protein n=1 Tax=Mucilaginibacter aquariorum TaxID=2967225 RepID=A0ABT1T3L4_9SPHI|nr:hypothetical protein [Mucilaginibacter aquariorum]MCQ6959201.1 hypothetical protein [Mucilaginibacter aquariorum]